MRPNFHAPCGAPPLTWGPQVSLPAASRTGHEALASPPFHPAQMPKSPLVSGDGGNIAELNKSRQQTVCLSRAIGLHSNQDPELTEYLGLATPKHISAPGKIYGHITRPTPKSLTVHKPRTRCLPEAATAHLQRSECCERCPLTCLRGGCSAGRRRGSGPPQGLQRLVQPRPLRRGAWGGHRERRLRHHTPST